MKRPQHNIEQLTRWVGSVQSLIVHTIIFGFALAVGLLKLADWDTVLLLLTTAVSLEAIYMAIFIQMAVNQNTASLREVEQDVDEIQKDIDAIEQDVDEIQEGDEIEKLRDAQHRQELQSISKRLQQLLEDVNNMNK